MINFKKYIIILCFACLAFFIPQNIKAIELSAQQLEILQQEILLLQTLINNYNLNKGIDSASYIAVDISDNSVVLEKNSNQSLPIASITKLMNAVISLENIDLNKTIVLTDQMLLPLGQSPCIYSGLQISAENLLKSALIQSSNDAAEALSYFIGKEKFIDLMNQKALEIGMKNTIYYDANGLNLKNKSTATDLAKLISYIDKNYPKIWEIGKNNDFWLPDQTGRMLKFKNVNNFYPIHNFIGGKTGYTIEAKQTIASVFEINNRKIAIIVLYSNNRIADVFEIIKKIRK